MSENYYDPRNKCGYISIWIGLKCKNSVLIEKYNLEDFSDLMNLLHNGSELINSLYEENNVKIYYDTLSISQKHAFDFFKEKFLNDTNHFSVSYFYFITISIYLNIKIILIDENDNELDEPNNLIIYGLNLLNLIPKDNIKIKLSNHHAEYSPEDSEIDTYQFLKNKLDKRSLHYDNLEKEELEIKALEEYFNKMDINKFNKHFEQFEELLEEFNEIENNF